MILGISSIIIGYLLGSIPTAYIVTKMRKGIDIRTVDVRNMGGGSVLRQVGIWEGALVLVVDMAKGAASIYIAQALGVSILWVFGAGFAAILGHNYPLYLSTRLSGSNKLEYPIDPYIDSAEVSKNLSPAIVLTSCPKFLIVSYPV